MIINTDKNFGKRNSLLLVRVQSDTTTMEFKCGASQKHQKYKNLWRVGRDAMKCCLLNMI